LGPCIFRRELSTEDLAIEEPHGVFCRGEGKFEVPPYVAYSIDYVYHVGTFKIG